MASGLETETALRSISWRDGGWLLPGPIEGRLGMLVTELSPAGSRSRMPIPAEDPTGERAGLALAINVLADTAGGLALSAYRPDRDGGPTIELRLDHAARPAEEASWLYGEAALLHEVGGAGYLAISVSDDTGRSVARAEGHYLFRAHQGTQGNAAGTAPNPAPNNTAPNNTAAGAAPRTELDCPSDEVGAPAALLRALAPTGTDPEVWRLPAAEQLANPRGDVHGGALLTIGELAQRRFLADSATGAGPMTPLTLLTLQAQYLSPAPARGAELTCRTAYVRRGRGFSTVRTELVRQDGRIATLVTGLWSAVQSPNHDH
jgi:acyl-coenzyme A thioesterase PaaI-like protein